MQHGGGTGAGAAAPVPQQHSDSGGTSSTDAGAAAVAADMTPAARIGSQQQLNSSEPAAHSLAGPVGTTTAHQQEQAAGAASMGDAVAAAVLAQFAALPKTGKPQPHEHTVLAGIALLLPAAEHDGQPPAGTGTKCLGASRRLPGGAALNDCHAEVLCRRALLRWLYAEVSEVAARYARAAQAAAGSTSGSCTAAADPAALATAASTRVLRLVPPADQGSSPASGSASSGGSLYGGWRLQLQSGVQLHMYVSQPPCGDASILCSPSCQASLAGAAGEQTVEGSSAAPAGSYGRTGAKPVKRQRVDDAVGGSLPALPEQPQQQQAQQGQGQGEASPPQHQQQQWRLPQQHEVESYGEAQATGLVRRKPGRGDATLSMSCSDKLARWALLGLQGSLLSELLVGPLHLTSLTISLQQPAEPAPSAAADAAATPPPEQPPPSLPASDAAKLAAAAAEALHRALVGRTAAVARERLHGGSRPAEPLLHVCVPQPAAAAPGIRGAAADPVQGLAGGASGAEAASASLHRMQELGLAPSAARRVGSGSSIVWHAPPSPAFKWREARRLQPPPPQHAAAAAAAHAAGAALPAVLSGGSVEAVAGTTGLKIGAAKARPGQPVHPSAQSAVCKAALFAAWRCLEAALRQLPARAPAATAPAAAPTGTARPEGDAPGQRMTYRQAKQAAGAGYASAWRRLREPPSPFEGWIPKPPALEDFGLGS